MSGKTEITKKPRLLHIIQFCAVGTFILNIVLWTVITVLVSKIPDTGLLCSGEEYKGIKQVECGIVSAIIGEVTLENGDKVVPPLERPGEFIGKLLGILVCVEILLFLIIRSIRKPSKTQYIVWNVLYTLSLLGQKSIPVLGPCALLILCVKSTRDYFASNTLR